MLQEPEILVNAGVGFFLLAILLIMIILASRIVKASYQSKESVIRNDAGKIVYNLVSKAEATDAEQDAHSFRYWITEIEKITRDDRFSRQVILDILMEVKRNLTGTSVFVIRKVYTSLSLQNVSEAKLRSWSSSVKIQGIRELAAMDYHAADKNVAPFLKAKDPKLQQEALTAMVRLDPTKTLQFLDEYLGEITEWMKVQIYQNLLRWPYNSLPDFSRWFDHPNREVVSFSIAMTRSFRQAGAVSKLVELLSSSDRTMVHQSVMALAEIEVYQHEKSVSALVSIWWDEPLVLKSAAQCLAKIGTLENSADALIALVDHPEDEVKFEAIRTLTKLGYPIHQLRLDPASHRMLAHIEEPLLKI